MMATDSNLSPRDNVAAIKALEHASMRIARERRFLGVFTTNTSPLTQVATFNFSNFSPYLKTSSQPCNEGFFVYILTYKVSPGLGANFVIIGHSVSVRVRTSVFYLISVAINILKYSRIYHEILHKTRRYLT